MAAFLVADTLKTLNAAAMEELDAVANVTGSADVFIRFFPNLVAVNMSTPDPQVLVLTFKEVHWQYLRGKMRGVWHCKEDGHSLCVVRDNGEHCAVTEAALEDWISAIHEGEATVWHPPKSLALDAGPSATNIELEGVLVDQPDNPFATPITAFRRMHSAPSMTGSVTETLDSIVSSAIGPGYYAGKGLHWIGSNSLRGIENVIVNIRFRDMAVLSRTYRLEMKTWIELWNEIPNLIASFGVQQTLSSLEKLLHRHLNSNKSSNINRLSRHFTVSLTWLLTHLGFSEFQVAGLSFLLRLCRGTLDILETTPDFKDNGTFTIKELIWEIMLLQYNLLEYWKLPIEAHPHPALVRDMRKSEEVRSNDILLQYTIISMVHNLRLKPANDKQLETLDVKLFRVMLHVSKHPELSLSGFTLDAILNLAADRKNR
ncbi:hypothetical protein M422DRAFT_786295 [Sphaerobolus stellatus SS14]|uniref:Uncharacterized protein n=1 Tax=Sphaerobolus stellatus (strain SS14) TaxID=990650 RepID=A0A0C9UC23_SPHS4|nr:hypothetical protein M422DRAFT_786295 [Sphaerobolus stellatus SS14]